MTNATATSAAQFTPQQREVSRATETTAGQIDSMLAKDSPLLRRARAQAMEGMNQRGLLNSSMSQGAAVAAMIDRVVPIAEKDAQIYNERTVNNQNAVNSAGMFNAGEQNKFGLQLGEQDFTRGENETQRKFQTSERMGGQAFTAEQTLLTQQFNAAQSELDRALQASLADKSIEAQERLERARQVFQSAESALDRANQKALQENQQAFQATQNDLDRQQQYQLQTAAQQFQASESEKNRAAELMLADKNITATQALEIARQSFQAEQNGLDRNQALTLAREGQTFQASENEMDRAQQLMLADKQITANQALEKARQEFQRGENALDRTQQKEIQTSQQDFQRGENALDRQQQKELQTAQQDFQRAQAELDRAQQRALQDSSIAAQQALETARQNFQAAENVLDRAQQNSLADKQIAANQALETARQQFQATQAQLDRTQQESMTNLQNSLNQSNASLNFAASLTLNTSSAINAIQADPNLTPEAKKGAIDNVIASANATMQWASTFYNTALPTIAAPGGTPGAVSPGTGPGAGTGAAALAPSTNTPTFPANVASYTLNQKAQVYNDLRAQGFTDTQIRSAWEAQTGQAAPNEDWDLLKTTAGGLISSAMQ